MSIEALLSDLTAALNRVAAALESPAPAAAPEEVEEDKAPAKRTKKTTQPAKKTTAKKTARPSKKAPARKAKPRPKPQPEPEEEEEDDAIEGGEETDLPTLDEVRTRFMDAGTATAREVLNNLGYSRISDIPEEQFEEALEELEGYLTEGGE